MHRTPHPVTEFKRLCRWQRLPAGPAAGQAGQVVFVKVRVREQVVVHRRHPVDHGGTMLANRPQHRTLLEAGQHDEGCARHDAAVEDARSIDVRARQRADDPVVRTARRHQTGPDAGIDDRAMALHRALGKPGRARGVADRRRVAGLARHRIERRLALAQPGAERSGAGRAVVTPQQNVR